MDVVPNADYFSSTGHLGAWANITGTFNNSKDNGALVFNFYENFAGTSLPSYASIINSPTADNGLVFAPSLGYQGIAFNTSLPSSGAIVESGYYYPNSTELGGGTDYEVGFGYGGFGSSMYENGYGSSNFGGSNNGLYVIDYSSASQGIIAGPTGIGTPSANVHYKNYFAFGPNGALTSGWDSTYLSATSTTYSLSQVTQVWVWHGVAGPYIITNWLRVRTYVSSMPTFTVGTGTSYYSVSFHESGLPSGTEWWANVTGQTSHSSTTPYVNSTLPNGTYYYNVSSSKYTPSPSVGSFTVNGANVHIPNTRT